MFKISIDINQIAAEDSLEYSKKVRSRYSLLKRYLAAITLKVREYFESKGFHLLASESGGDRAHFVYSNDKINIILSNHLRESPPFALIELKIPKEMIAGIEALIKNKGISTKFISLVH